MTARLVPPVIPDHATGSERRVLEKLQRDLGREWLVLHALGLRSHETKRWAEADCVLIGPTGLFVIEIKGGSVRCEDGLWTVGDGDRQYAKAENPWDQAMGALGAIEKLLCHADARFRQVLTGFGVVMPDVEFDVRSASIEPRVLMDKRGFREPAIRYVERLASHWRDASAAQRSKRGLTPDDIRRAREILRPDVVRIVGLTSQIADAEGRLTTLTREQVTAAERMASNPRTLVTGGAGTGKTLIAINRARDLAAQGRRVLFLCFNQLLAQHLRRRFRDDPVLAGVDMHHLHGLYQQTIEQAGRWEAMQANAGTPDYFDIDMPRQFQEAALELDLPAWDALIVDEAQDILSRAHLEALDWMLGDAGLARGRWHLFMDDRQDLYAKPDARDAMATLEAAHPARDTLRVNCRNTRPIASLVRHLTGLGSDAAPDAAGPTPDIRTYRDRADALRQLEACVTMLRKQDIPTDDIILLSTRKRERSLIAGVASLAGLPIIDARQASAADQPAADGLRFSTMQAFKGLERPVVIAIDLEEAGDSKWAAVHYVGLSRAKSLLCLIVPEGMREGIEAGLQSGRIVESAPRVSERILAF